MARDQVGAAPSNRVALQGIAVEVPLGWECRIRKGGKDRDEATVMPVVHAATVPLPADRADYGGGVVEQLTDRDVFVSLVEFGSESVGSKLFPERDSIPSLTPEMFQPFQLQRLIRGQAGTQVFFTYSGRAFCLYVVIGAHTRRQGLVKLANQLISQISVGEGA